MVATRRTMGCMRRQNGAGFFDLIKKGAKFLGGKKARKILNLTQKTDA